jgi:hypothetical protein
MDKIVPGMARKPDDIKAIYEKAMTAVKNRGRVTGQGKEYTDYLNEVFDTMEIDQIEFQVAVEYIAEVSGKEDKKKLKTSLRAFLRNKGIPFKTYQAAGKGTPLIIERVK